MSQPRRVTVEPGRVAVEDPAAGVEYVVTHSPVAATGTVRGRVFQFHTYAPNKYAGAWEFRVPDAARTVQSDETDDWFHLYDFDCPNAGCMSAEEAVRHIDRCLVEYAALGIHIVTEADWFAAQRPDPLLTFALPHLGPREMRLIGVAVARLALPLARAKQTRQALELVEAWVDVPELGSDLRLAYDRANAGLARRDAEGNLNVYLARRAAVDVAKTDPLTWREHGCARSALSGGTRMSEEAVRQVEVALVRDIAGNPFRPVTFAPEWLTPTVVGLATATDQTRDYTRLPILADALEEAGCDVADVLGHCRDPGPHARGCWVLDGLKGRARG